MRWNYSVYGCAYDAKTWIGIAIRIPRKYSISFTNKQYTFFEQKYIERDIYLPKQEEIGTKQIFSNATMLKTATATYNDDQKYTMWKK